MGQRYRWIGHLRGMSKGGVTELSERTSYLETEDRLSIVVSAKSDGQRAMLRWFWSVAWIFIGGYVFYELRNSGLEKEVKLVLNVFLVFWFYYLVRIVRTLFWQLKGEERLLLKEDGLTLKDAFGEWGKAVSYHVDNVSPMQAREKDLSWRSLFEDSFWALGLGSAQFQVEGKMLSFGRELDDKERNALIRLFNKKLKQLKRQVETS